jgi:hypothetical protein
VSIEENCIEAADCDGPMSALNEAQKHGLPVWLKIGGSSFRITPENFEAFNRAILFATDDAWQERGKRLNSRCASELTEAQQRLKAKKFP